MQNDEDTKKKTLNEIWFITTLLKFCVYTLSVHTYERMNENLTFETFVIFKFNHQSLSKTH